MFDHAHQEAGEGPSLREITRRLTTPALSGLALTKVRLGQLAMDLSLPIGFGERSEMLLNLFRAAAEMEALPGLLAALRAETDRWDQRYAEWSERFPASRPIWDEWRRKLGESRALLEDMLAVAR